MMNMNSLYNNNRGCKVFWFVETKGGNQKLVRPDGTSEIFNRKNEYFEELGRQALAGWQRSMLLMQEYNIWDATAFSCTMSVLIGVRTSRYENGKRIAYIFSNCERAEELVYPFLSEEQVQICRENVDKFYANPNVQAAWHDFILHPVSLKVIEDSEELVPISIDSIGDGQGAMCEYQLFSIGSFKDREGRERLFKEWR